MKNVNFEMSSALDDYYSNDCYEHKISKSKMFNLLVAKPLLSTEEYKNFQTSLKTDFDIQVVFDFINDIDNKIVKDDLPSKCNMAEVFKPTKTVNLELHESLIPLAQERATSEKLPVKSWYEFQIAWRCFNPTHYAWFRLWRDEMYKTWLMEISCPSHPTYPVRAGVNIV